LPLRTNYFARIERINRAYKCHSSSSQALQTISRSRTRSKESFRSDQCTPSAKSRIADSLSLYPVSFLLILSRCLKRHLIAFRLQDKQSTNLNTSSCSLPSLSLRTADRSERLEYQPLISMAVPDSTTISRPKRRSSLPQPPPSSSKKRKSVYTEVPEISSPSASSSVHGEDSANEDEEEEDQLASSQHNTPAPAVKASKANKLTKKKKGKKAEPKELPEEEREWLAKMLEKKQREAAAKSTPAKAAPAPAPAPEVNDTTKATKDSRKGKKKVVVVEVSRFLSLHQFSVYGI